MDQGNERFLSQLQQLEDRLSKSWCTYKISKHEKENWQVERETKWVHFEITAMDFTIVLHCKSFQSCLSHISLYLNNKIVLFFRLECRLWGRTVTWSWQKISKRATRTMSRKTNKSMSFISNKDNVPTLDISVNKCCLLLYYLLLFGWFFCTSKIYEIPQFKFS